MKPGINALEPRATASEPYLNTFSYNLHPRIAEKATLVPEVQARITQQSQ